jgi:metallo-beta-lactamase class B
MRKLLIAGVSLAAALVLPAGAQNLPPNAPTKEQLANNNKLFIELAAKYLRWD